MCEYKCYFGGCSVIIDALQTICIGDTLEWTQYRKRACRPITGRMLMEGVQEIGVI